MHLCSTLAVAVAIAAGSAAGAHGPHPPEPRLDAAPVSSSLKSWICSSPVHSLFRAHCAASQRPAGSRPLRHGDRIPSKYSGHVLLRLNISAPADQAAFGTAAAALALDVWSVARGHADVRVPADDVKSLMALLPETMQNCATTLSTDLAAQIAHTYPQALREEPSASEPLDTASYAETIGNSLTVSDDMFFQDYQPLSRWIDLLQAMFPTHVHLVNIGTSFEGREITGIRIGINTDPSDESPRKTVLVTGGLHAREWVSISSVNYLAWSFATRYGRDHVVTKIIESFDIVFIPVTNPDGFEYTWTTDRLWRKSRQPTAAPYCHGLDLDHTFSFGWDGTSELHKNPCSEAFAGSEPFQATETAQLASWARNVTESGSTKFISLIDLHSYSQQVLFPYSHSCHIEPPNLENLEELAAGLAKAIRLSDGGIYTFASACEGSVATSGPHLETGGGSAIDWFYHEMQAHYSYQIKLQDTGVYGFLLPREYIIPSGEEMFSALKYFGDFLLGNNGIEHSGALSTDQLEQDFISVQANQEL
ncbi:hypothetical protein BROUX41_003662 [Berkeleyomyces rouxiae]|uniref:uncharacterized protein n=1 Tax=Berkeleyomyces rouxiae TaxID=2035830 RepID=UPI003B785162